MSFLASSLRACFYRIHREHSAREADLCFQETPERHRGPDRTASLLLRWRKRRAALHGATLRAAGLGKQCRDRRGQHEEGSPARLLLPKLREQPHTGALVFLASSVLVIDSYQSSSSKFLQRGPKFKCMTHPSFLLSVWDSVINTRIPKELCCSRCGSAHSGLVAGPRLCFVGRQQQRCCATGSGC